MRWPFANASSTLPDGARFVGQNSARHAVPLGDALLDSATHPTYRLNPELAAARVGGSVALLNFFSASVLQWTLFSAEKPEILQQLSRRQNGGRHGPVAHEETG